MNKIMINADDFGFNESCTKAIIEAFEKGYITTTTACANGEYFDEAVALARQGGFEKAIGIHFNLTEGKALTEGIKRFADFYGDEGFNGKWNRKKSLSKEKKEAVYQELTAQAERFKQTGLTVHHADSHHHIHNAPAIFSIYMQVIKEQGIAKVRKFRNVGNISFIKKVAKAVYNCKLKSKGYAYTEKFGSFEDVCSLDLRKETSVEMMVHPDFENGKLIDRASLAEYDNPYGREYEEIIAFLRDRGVAVEKV